MKDPQDKRQYVRIPAMHVVHCERYDFIPHYAEGDSKTINLSIGGVLIETKEKFAVNETLRVELFLPEWDQFVTIRDARHRETPCVKALVTVKWVNHLFSGMYQIGVQFIGMPEEHKQALQKYIESFASKKPLR